jgi:hypothetical protein
MFVIYFTCLRKKNRRAAVLFTAVTTLSQVFSCLYFITYTNKFNDFVSELTMYPLSFLHIPSKQSDYCFKKRHKQTII